MTEVAKGGNGAAAGLLDDVLKRRKQVVLSDGSSVWIEKWTLVKQVELMSFIGKLEKLPVVVEASLIPEDRPKLANMENDDVLLVALAANQFNRTKEFVKNFKALAEDAAQTVESVPKGAPSKAS